MDQACGTRSCHAISTIVVDVVSTLLSDMAVDGKVELGTVQKLLDLVRRGTVSLDEAFKVQEEKCRQTHSKPKGNVGARSNPFQRLMVRPFEHMLVGDRPTFPRPLLPHYFEFLERVLGSWRDSYERDCRAIIQALLVVHGNNLTWDHFYSDPRTLRTLRSALKQISHNLATGDGQHLWHQCMARGTADIPAPTTAQLNDVRAALLETHRGLSEG